MHVVGLVPGAGSSSGAVSSTVTASPSPGLSVPGTHQATARYQITSPVSTVVVVSHVGNVTVTGGSGPGVSVTQQVYYSKTPPATTRTVSGRRSPSPTTAPPARLRRRLHAGRAALGGGPGDRRAGAVRLTGLAGSVTAKADVGLINATGLTSASVSLSTRVGGISASFAAAPTTSGFGQVGAITLHVPGTASYKVTADARVGKTTVSAPQSASSGHAITATTDVGAIIIAPST